VFSQGQKTAFEKWPVFGRILTYVLETECVTGMGDSWQACQESLGIPGNPRSDRIPPEYHIQGIPG